MKLLWMAIPMALALLAGTAPAALASEPPSCTWNCVWAPPSPDQQQVNANRAVAEEIARRRGYGPANIDSHAVTNIGEQDITNNIAGDSISTGANNSVNSNSTTTSADGASNVTIITRSNQVDSGNTSQNATANTTTTDADGTTVVSATTHSSN